ncbi:site-specific recombinase XerD [Salegentibacter mishustinae]|uniref:Recombinase n=2 Tax=Salegentibacter mishustinae TaxID=270918 RepID=A0A0Q9ZEL2_9FLAO|nr:site-specific integrase [Salegentibacter mishustinae]KRG27412.1 recombinase [Salegentibacter mishustinae]PNW20530.1 recombinase [Salegentibacter mishustinae]PZX63337.1 site-specific recombinase XerD [Salegentibacter mishustinae]GGW93413.1 transposase [Salegentibacter mishustinae]
MQDLFSVLFYVRKSKNKSATHAMVYLRITYEGKRAEASTMRKVNLSKWNAKANKMSGTSAEAKQVNRNLDIIKNRIYEIYQKFLENGEEITAVNIKDEFLGKNKDDKRILKIFEDHNLRMEKLVDKDYSFRTLQRYKTTKKHLTNFISSSYKADDFRVKDIDIKFINSFMYYLKTELNHSHNSALKYLAYLKKIVRIAVANGWLEKDPFYNFKQKRQVIDREFLTKEEIIKIMEKTFTIQRMEQVRDAFLFSCYTGCSYSDIKKLTKQNIIKGIDGSQWLKFKRTKTRSLSSVPLLTVPEELIKKYEDFDNPKGTLLPVLSNQKTNGYLKEIADLCEIQKKLTFHVARHTFATTVTLSNGVPIESVSKMLGHRSIKITQHYAKVLDEKLSEDMNNLKNRMAASENKRKLK